jgi:hypothetical protein
MRLSDSWWSHPFLDGFLVDLDNRYIKGASSSGFTGTLLMHVKSRLQTCSESLLSKLGMSIRVVPPESVLQCHNASPLKFI